MDKDDRSLVKATLRGQTEAFEALVERYQKVVFNLAYRMTYDYDEAQDITQATFVKAYEKLRNFSDKYRFFSWLYRIAVNESINRLKRMSRLRELDPNVRSSAKSPADAYEERDLERKVHDALMELEPKYQLLIVLRYFRNLAYSEMVDILGIPEKKIKSRLFIARQLLRKVLVTRGIIGND